VIGRSFLFVALLTACRATEPDAPGDPITLVLAGEPGSQRVEVHGLPELTEPSHGWPALFSLSVASAHRAGGPAVVGRYELDEGVLAFEPRFDLEPGLEYIAVLRRAQLPNAAVDDPDLIQSLVVPRLEAPIAPTVEAVYPTARPLPANVLKFYVHFSRPMARGYAYEYAHVLEDSGARVEHPFLELAEELWNPAGTRLTLLVDPGRIKRGLLLHEQMGPVLEPGRSYTLLIEAGWPGADGAKLPTDIRVDFATAAADLTQPDPTRWSLELPAASTREPLLVILDEPHDHALLQHMIRVTGAEGRTHAGEVTVDAGETRWSFVPRQPWSPGAHTLVVDTELEDLAGNSAGRAFETHLDAPILAPKGAAIRVGFQLLR